jgi:hypothetical protein
MRRSMLREAERKQPVPTIASNLASGIEKVGRLIARTHAACRELSNRDKAAAD